MVKIIYYQHLDDVIQFIKEQDIASNICYFADTENIKLFYPALNIKEFIDIEHDDYESGFKIVFDRYYESDSYIEKAFIIEYLYTHYPRIIRYLKSFDHSDSNNIICFIDVCKANIFDLAFNYYHQTEYYNLSNGELLPYDLKSQVIFYKGSEVAITKKVKLPKFEQINIISSLKRYASDIKVLFIVFDNEYSLYLNPCYPVFEELQRRRIKYKILAGNKLAEQHLKNRGFNYDILTINSISTEVYANHFYNLFNEKPRNLYEYMLNLTLNTAYINWVSQHLFSNALENLDHYSHVFFVPDGTPMSYYATTRLKRSQKTCTILAAAIASLYRTLGLYNAGIIFCPGINARDTINKVFPDKEAVLTGSPVLYLYDQPTEKFDKKFILIATSGYDEKEHEWIETLLSHIDPNRALIYLKPHPFYKHKYEFFSEKMQGHILLGNLDSIDKYLSKADIVITDHSQVGRDAHLLDKPVISVNINKHVLHLLGISSILYPETVSELLEYLDQLLLNKRSVKVDLDFIDQYNYGNETKHYVKIADYIERGWLNGIKRLFRKTGLY